MDGKIHKEAGELQRKIELNLENSGSLANRTDQAEMVALTTRFPQVHALFIKQLSNKIYLTV